VVIEVQRPDLWWLTTGDVPGIELLVRAGLTSDIAGRVRILVEAVIAGEYRHETTSAERRGLLRNRWRRVWSETYVTAHGPVTSRHFGTRTNRQPIGRRIFAQ
jgi:hypothetical protein